MAEKKNWDSDYVQYLNDQADLLSQVDGVRYGWNDVEAIEKRLMGAAPAPKAPPVKPQPKPQPVTGTKPAKHSRLGLIASGIDIDF